MNTYMAIGWTSIADCMYLVVFLCLQNPSLTELVLCSLCLYGTQNAWYLGRDRSHFQIYIAWHINYKE